MNWIKNIFLKNNSDQSYNECSEIKHSIDAPKTYVIPNENNINTFNSNFMNDNNKDVKLFTTNTTESYLDEFQNYLENYYKQQNENNTSDIIKISSVSNNNNKVKLEHTTVNKNTEYDFSNTPENEKPFKMTHETGESVIHQDILMKTDVEYFHQQNDFNSTPEIISTQDVINNFCDIFNAQEIFDNTIDLEFQYNNVNICINETDRDKVIHAKHSGDVGNKESNNSTLIPFIVKNEVPITENMNGYQESPLGIQNFKENLTMVMDFDENNTISFKVPVPFNHKRAMAEDMFDSKRLSTNDSNKKIYKNTPKTELDIECLPELDYESSTLTRETINVLNLDNIATIPVKIETEDDKETKMENNDKEIMNCQNSRNISNENKKPIETDKITNNFKLLNKIKTSMNNELSTDVIIDLTDDQDVISLDSDDSDNGSYHSSDFEFINEDEAMLNEVCFVERKVASSVFAKPNQNVFPSEKIMEGYFDDRIAQSKDHSIPIGHSYYELFQGRYTPYPMQGMQNKCIGPIGGVGEGYRGVGFEVPRVDPVILPFDVRREASECANKIYNMYPVENPRRQKSTRNR